MENILELIPDPEKLRNVREFSLLENPYESNTKTDNLMGSAFREIIDWHVSNNKFYSEFLKLNGFNSTQIKSKEDLSKLPFIHANFFKMHEIPTIDKKDVFLHLTSSGTTGQKSQMFFDQWSIKSARKMVDRVFVHHGFSNPESEVNYLLLAYEPVENFAVGTTNTNVFLTSYAKPASITYALRNYGNGRHEFDYFGSVSALKKYEEEGIPVRIFGFPAFMFFILQKMRELNIKPLKLHPDSFVSFGGGWKGHTDKEISRQELYSMITGMLSVPDERIRQSYGSVEHSIPYFECKNHNLHKPVWSEIFIRDVKTLEVLGYNKTGYLQFVTPYITSVPAISVLMGDLGMLHKAEECGCGINTPYFEITGRAGISQNKSCAVSAAELLRKKG